MNLADLIPSLTKTDDRDKDAETLRVWVTAAVRVARADTAELATPAALTAHFEKLPAADLLKLSSALDETSGDVYGTVEELRRSLTTPNADRRDIVRRLAAIQATLDGLSRRRRRRSLLLIVARVAAVAIPLVVGYFAATYFRFYNNVYFDSAAVLVPAGAYQQRGSTFSIPASYKDRYFKEFSKYYFNRSSSFVQQFRTADVDSDVFKLRIVFRNPRNADALLISSAEVVATIHDNAFDWSRVDVSTDVEAQSDSEGFTLKDGGIGPAVSIQYKVTAGDLLVRDGSIPYLLNDKMPLPFEWTNSGIIILRTAPPASDTIDPVFWQLDPQQSPAPGAKLIPCADGRKFEQVATTTRLRQLTRIAKGGDAKLDVTFESLRGESTSRSLTAPLPSDLVYVESKSRLDERKDPCAPTMVPPAPPPPPPSSGMAAPFLDKIVGPPANLKGVDLIKAATTVSLFNVPDDGAVSRVVAPEEILNAGGFFMLDVTVESPRNGQIELMVSVNGKSVRVVTSELLIPDAWRFSRDLVKERARFQPRSTGR